MAAFPRRAGRLVILTGLVLLVFFLLQTNTPSSPPPPSRAPYDDFKPSSLDWSQIEPFFPPGPIKPLPSGKAHQLRRVQAPASSFKHTEVTEQRRQAVRDAFKRSWDAYRKYAWMKDELTPVSAHGKTTFGGWAATLVDSLDTLHIMGFQREFTEAVHATTSLDWGTTEAGAVNIFETTIRYLGGLLSAYDLSGDKNLLHKAVELGEMLYIGFDTPNRMPPFWLNFEEARDGMMVAGRSDASAAPTSLCVEFTRLSQITGDPKFYDATDRITRFVERIQNETSLPGMWPVVLDFRSERAIDYRFTLGAQADSLYEYLPKMYALLGGLDSSFETMYRTAMDVVIKKLLFRPMTPDQQDILFTGDYHTGRGGRFIPESQHLTCFAGGMFGLGGRLFGIDEHVSIGEKLARGCGWAYKSFPTGVMPEVFTLLRCEKRDACPWDEKEWAGYGNNHLAKGFTGASDGRYLLRPEAIESIFILYRITGNSDLQDIAWDMFQGIMKSTKTQYANSAIRDVRAKGTTTKLDSMEVCYLTCTLFSPTVGFFLLFFRFFSALFVCVSLPLHH